MSPSAPVRPTGGILHVDGVAGLSGDMALGALIDLGVPLAVLQEGLTRLRLPGWSLSAERVTSRGIAATRAHVHVKGLPPEAAHDHAHGHAHHHDSSEHGSAAGAPHAGHAHRSGRDIRALIEAAGLPVRVTSRALAVFARLCEAEAAVHGVASPDDVVLHEAGAVDALLDVVGTCLGLEALGVEHVSCSAPDIGGGSVHCAHGVLPVPGPAVLKLLEGRPVRSSGLDCEVLTPTGAALLVGLCESFGTRPPMTVVRTGLGAGTRALPDRANIARFTLGRPLEGVAANASRELCVIEADLDDADPELLAAFCDRARELGAVDAVLSPVVMKKGRAGTRITLCCDDVVRGALVDALFTETTTIGCRFHAVSRSECERETRTVTTPHGPVRVKVSRWNGAVVSVKPEHEDCLALARSRGVPLKDVTAAARAAASEERGS